MWNKILDFTGLFLTSGKLLGQNQPLILASSTAFFTLFSLPPMLIIVVNTLSLYFKAEELTVTFYGQIEDIFGSASSEQVQVIVSNFRSMGSNTWITLAGSAFLVFIATNLFKVIRLSINQIWEIRLKQNSNIFFKLKNRSIALAIILLSGVFFLLSTLSDSLISFIDKHIPVEIFNLDTVIIIIISKAVSIFFVTLWFIVIYRFLPSGRLKWHPIIVGAFVTSIFFILGKVILERFLINSNINDIFEASTSVVLIMLFIFYSSLIMYYGACFTVTYSKFIGQQVMAKKSAERFETKSLEENGFF